MKVRIIFSIIFFTMLSCTETSIHIAAKKGDLESVESLIKEGLDIEITDKSGKTPLHYSSDSKASAGWDVVMASAVCNERQVR